MAQLVLVNAGIWVGQLGLSAYSGSVSTALGVEAKDNTTFGTGGVRSNLAGLKTFGMGVEGLYQSNGTDAPDDVLFTRLGMSDIPVTVAPQNSGADGEVAYTLLALLANYTPRFSVGELAGFSVRGESGYDATHPPAMARGLIMHNAARTASGNGTARQLGALSASQRLYAALHVIAASTGGSPTLDVVIQSDDAVGMGSATNRITFAQAVGVGAQWGSVAGAVTDDWWRVNYTIGGAGPSFTFIVALGIL